MLQQLPHLSAYDPGTSGESGLDPLGFAGTAEALVNEVAPGIRARMSDLRSVTATAVFAHALLPVAGERTADGTATWDIVAEWMLVEAALDARLTGSDTLPGMQKAGRSRERITAQTYLKGPRVFGFTGVHRPYSLHTAVIDTDGCPAASAEQLLRAWEQDCGLVGFVDDDPGTAGAEFRADILRHVRSSLRASQSKAPKAFLPDVCRHVRPPALRPRERAAHRELLDKPVSAAGTDPDNSLRIELGRWMRSQPPGTHDGSTNTEVLQAAQSAGLSEDLTVALEAVAAYERASSAVDATFRNLLAAATTSNSAIVEPRRDEAREFVADLAREVPPLVRAAVDAAAAVSERLAGRVEQDLCLFGALSSPEYAWQALVERHDQVQQARRKSPWLVDTPQGPQVRSPYRRADTVEPRSWIHPLRLTTLWRFVEDSR